MIIPTLFTLAALGLSAIAFGLGGPAWVLAWPALGSAMVATAYWGSWPRLFGKRDDGRFPLILTISGLPMFGLLYAIWITERMVGEPASDEVAPGIYVGRRPRAVDLPANVETIVDLTAEWPSERGVREHPGYRLHRVLDARIGDAEAIEAIARPLVERRGPMLIHCASGHGRSATIAAAVGLARGDFADPTDAITKMKAARPWIHLNRLQRRRLGEWFARYSQATS